ncbi:ECF-type riboflavin transporter substrate-binding protein [Radiobacillus kanasensis]|uniref:ECF-type riboflavin transporter substrate-binding protein n=1 Tax=Radiobacillus kanasensis TaxID=2844358 RepID=UPI001E5C28B1|nr:ECF-type riboflavin transporter substrate-binding protein [Radiobacillus kanasensis]UFT98332.1 ECF-type riboflavin transporter substrate-binding protein [Radiobacillus kanasensis]
MSKGLATKTIVAIGIGTAVFVILNRFAAIPTGVPNTNFQTSYAFLALMAILFGPVAGFLIGFIGHALTDAIVWGSVWWSWVIVSGFVGLTVGLFSKRIQVEEGNFGLKQIVTFNIAQIVANGIGWFVLAPLLDILIYAEPANKVFVQGLVAGGFNILTAGVLGTILLTAYAKTRSKSNSLELDA